MTIENMSLEHLAESVQRDLTRFENEGFPLVEDTAPVAEYLLPHDVNVSINIEGMRRPKQARVNNPCFRVEATPRPGASRVSLGESDLCLVVYDSKEGRRYNDPMLELPEKIEVVDASYVKHGPRLSIVVMGDNPSMSPGYQNMTGSMSLSEAR